MTVGRNVLDFRQRKGVVMNGDLVRVSKFIHEYKWNGATWVIRYDRKARIWTGLKKFSQCGFFFAGDVDELLAKIEGRKHT